MSGQCRAASFAAPTYKREYHDLTRKDGSAFRSLRGLEGHLLLRIHSPVHCIVRCICWAHLVPVDSPDPTIIQTAPRPDFFFLWLYALLSYLPPSFETPFLLIGPAIAILLLIALPFFAGEGEKSWKRRPIAVLSVLLLAVASVPSTIWASTHPGAR